MCVCVRERVQGTEMERGSSKSFCIRNQKEAICIIFQLYFNLRCLKKAYNHRWKPDDAIYRIVLLQV